MPSRWRALLLWTLAGVAIVLGAAFFAGPVHELAVDTGVMSTEPGRYDRGFLRVFRRLLMIPLLILLLVELRPWRGAPLRSYGLLGPAARWRPALAAYGLTLLAGCALLAWHFAAGWLMWDPDPDWGAAAGRAAKRLGGGLAIGAMEEWFFRGWLVVLLARRHPPARAVLLSALVFGLLHAFRPSTLNAPVTHDTLGALGALGSWLGHMLDPIAFGPTFLGLFLLALLLSAAYARTRTLWTPIAIHAAGVFLVYSYGAVTQRDPARTWAGTWHLYDGLPAWVLMGLVAWWLWRRAKSDASPPPASGSSLREAAG